MVIKIAEISQDIDTLTEEAQILLLDFIQLLKKRYPKPENQLIENEITFSSTQKFCICSHYLTQSLPTIM